MNKIKTPLITNLSKEFDKNKIGSRMSSNFISILNTSSVKEAMSQLIAQAAKNDNITTLYLVVSKNTFCGAIDLKDLIIARQNTPLSEISTASYPYVYAQTSIEDCIPLVTDYATTSLPVLDNNKKLIGVVTTQDFLELIDDELSDDYAKLASLPSKEEFSESINKSIKKRFPWLFILMIMGLGVSAAVGLFESVIKQLPLIICFQSLILDMAGNVGTQSLAVTIRILSKAQVNKKNQVSLIFKEMQIGLLNGVILGVLSFFTIGAFLCLKGNPFIFSFAISSCLAVAMILTMVISALLGTIIPIFFRQIGIDPAVASGPLITTINDLVAVVIYYGLAWLLIINILHLA